MVLKRPSTTLALKKRSHLCWGFRFLLGLLTCFFWISAYRLFELISWISGWHDLVESLQFGSIWYRRYRRRCLAKMGNQHFPRSFLFPDMFVYQGRLLDARDLDVCFGDFMGFELFLLIHHYKKSPFREFVDFVVFLLFSQLTKRFQILLQPSKMYPPGN